VARLAVVGDQLVVRLNPIEQLAAWRWRPREALSQVESVEVLASTPPTGVSRLVRMGFAAETAPMRGLATVGPRAWTRPDNRDACVVLYRSGPGVLVRFRESARWGLFLISSRNPVQVAERVATAAGVRRR
jgi:hypothetical protein